VKTQLGVEVAIVKSPSKLYVAFRGTDGSNEDLLLDLNANLKPLEFPNDTSVRGKIHDGFQESVFGEYGVYRVGLKHCYDTADDRCMRRALLEYSQLQLPEGHALSDLASGPKPAGPIQRISVALKTARDVLFRGRLGIGELPLETKLTTSLESFAEIRRLRNGDYTEDFPCRMSGRLDYKRWVIR